MLIFSTSLPVIDNLDRMKFIELGVTWNQESPNDALKDKEWDGKSISFHWVDENKDFEVSSLDNITAIKLAQCKTLWDFGFRTYDARLKSMIFKNRYSSSAIP